MMLLLWAKFLTKSQIVFVMFFRAMWELSKKPKKHKTKTHLKC